MSFVFEDYQYQNLPLTASVAEYIILNSMRGRQLSRKDIIRFVSETHVVSGGTSIEDYRTTQVVKKSLNNLKRKQLVENPVSGIYRILSGGLAESDADVSDGDEPEEDDLVSTPKLSPLLSLGSGIESVYVYYYPVYQTEAAARGVTTWLCKVGRTDATAPFRVFSQATGMPELPVIALEYRTDNSRMLESVIQGILSLRGKRSTMSPGSEWYTTSVNEVLEILDFVLADEAAKEALKNAK
jgi:hypothetical protein